MLLSLASQPGSALEQMHIFTLAHILRRPIIVYGVKYVKSFRGEALGYARFEGKVFQFIIIYLLFFKKHFYKNFAAFKFIPFFLGGGGGKMSIWLCFRLSFFHVGVAKSEKFSKIYLKNSLMSVHILS